MASDGPSDFQHRDVSSLSLGAAKRPLIERRVNRTALPALPWTMMEMSARLPPRAAPSQAWHRSQVIWPPLSALAGHFLSLVVSASSARRMRKVLLPAAF